MFKGAYRASFFGSDRMLTAGLILHIDRSISQDMIICTKLSIVQTITEPRRGRGGPIRNLSYHFSPFLFLALLIVNLACCGYNG